MRGGSRAEPHTFPGAARLLDPLDATAQRQKEREREEGLGPRV